MILLDEGRVAATGTHAELLATTPLYGEVLARTALDGTVAVADSTRRRLMGWGGGFGGGGGFVGAHGRATQAGLPFGGIPTELQLGVDKILATEPEHARADVAFTQRPSERDAAPALDRRCSSASTPASSRRRRSLVLVVGVARRRRARSSSGRRSTRG